MRHKLTQAVFAVAAIAALTLSLAACGRTGEAQTADAEATPNEAPRAEGSILKQIFRSAPEVVEVPAGIVLRLSFDNFLSSHRSSPGETFRARVVQAVSVDGVEAIPTGATVVGTVTEARGPKKVGGRARLSLDFHTLELPDGKPVAIAAAFAARGKSETPKDAAIIGGSTLAGAILGEEVDDGEGGVIGAIVGGLAGTAAAIKTKGKPVEVARGTVMTIELTRPVTVRVG